MERLHALVAARVPHDGDAELEPVERIGDGPREVRACDEVYVVHAPVAQAEHSVAQLGYVELLPRALGRGDGRVLAVGAAEGAAGEEYGPAAALTGYAGLLAEVRRGPRRVGEGAHAAVSAPAELAVHAAVPRAVMARAHSPISSFVCP